MLLLQYAEGSHCLCLDAARDWTRDWCKMHFLNYVAIRGGVPSHINGSGCFKKLYPLKEVLGYEGQDPSDLNAIQAQAGYKPEEGELIIWADSDWLVVNRKKADPKQIQEILGDKDLACLYHPDSNGAWRNLGFFAFKNTPKMRAYLNALWDNPAIEYADLPEPIIKQMKIWYMRRWKGPTDETQVSSDVLAGKITTVELPFMWNMCSPDMPRDSVMRNALGYHETWVHDKEACARHMEEIIFQARKAGL